MEKISIKGLINDKKIGCYRVGYKDESELKKSLSEARVNGLLNNLGLSYSLTYEDAYIVFILHNSTEELINNL